MNIEIKNNLLEIQYRDIADLQAELTPQLLRIDTIGLKKTDYTGFNYKAKILRKWGTPVMKKLLYKYPVDYVIAYVQGDLETQLHEYSHYLYFNDPDYRQQAHNKYACNKEILNKLRKMGYRESVLIDEATAFYGLN